MTFLVVRWAVIVAYIDGNAAPHHGAVFFKTVTTQRHKPKYPGNMTLSWYYLREIKHA
jgi:hypothetical protein